MVATARKTTFENENVRAVVQAAREIDRAYSIGGQALADAANQLYEALALLDAAEVVIK